MTHETYMKTGQIEATHSHKPADARAQAARGADERRSAVSASIVFAVLLWQIKYRSCKSVRFVRQFAERTIQRLDPKSFSSAKARSVGEACTHIRMITDAVRYDSLKVFLNFLSFQRFASSSALPFSHLFESITKTLRRVSWPLIYFSRVPDFGLFCLHPCPSRLTPSNCAPRPEVSVFSNCARLLGDTPKPGPPCAIRLICLRLIVILIYCLAL